MGFINQLKTGGPHPVEVTWGLITRDMVLLGIPRDMASLI